MEATSHNDAKISSILLHNSFISSPNRSFSLLLIYPSAACWLLCAACLLSAFVCDRIKAILLCHAVNCLHHSFFFARAHFCYFVIYYFHAKLELTSGRNGIVCLYNHTTSASNSEIVHEREKENEECRKTPLSNIKDERGIDAEFFYTIVSTTHTTYRESGRHSLCCGSQTEKIRNRNLWARASRQLDYWLLLLTLISVVVRIWLTIQFSFNQIRIDRTVRWGEF